ncbi:GntR family transcriptional regulator [Ornithinimicrobium sufpigmenti]|uniref:GntR family transcriptional regulator n=1 Tax=Ornithinimicrobium sufpigmenti TaxID=2508882 RepID=UPI001036673A|nr:MULTISPECIES: GntR family transcriptional regulator [unclassified Ornithinimicrobium]
MRLSISQADPRPPYVQVRAQIEEAIRTGRLPDQTHLPPVRQLAADLGLATGTVARAYKELEAEGLVRTARGAGTRAVAPRDAGRPGEVEEARRHAAAVVTRLRSLGLSDEAIVEAVLSALRAAPSRADPQ